MNITLTLVLQLVFFFVFIWFCMKFVWPPLLNMMQEREQKIADGLDAAARAEKDLELAKKSATSRMKEAKEEAAAIIDAANKRAASIVEEAKEDARSESQRIRATAEAELEQEVNAAREALRASVAALTLAGAEKILEKEVDQSAHSALLDKLAAEL